jgi:hypothetical protein
MLVYGLLSAYVGPPELTTVSRHRHKASGHQHRLLINPLHAGSWCNQAPDGPIRRDSAGRTHTLHKTAVGVYKRFLLPHNSCKALTSEMSRSKMPMVMMGMARKKL